MAVTSPTEHTVRLIFLFKVGTEISWHALPASTGDAPRRCNLHITARWIIDPTPLPSNEAQQHAAVVCPLFYFTSSRRVMVLFTWCTLQATECLWSWCKIGSSDAAERSQSEAWLQHLVVYPFRTELKVIQMSYFNDIWYEYSWQQTEETQQIIWLEWSAADNFFSSIVKHECHSQQKLVVISEREILLVTFKRVCYMLSSWLISTKLSIKVPWYWVTTMKLIL